jgi:hypothetical protein
VNRVQIVQQFKTYADVNPNTVAAEIQSDLQSGAYGYIKQMDVVQFQTQIAAWALWQREDVR